MRIENKFEISDTVYLRTDENQLARLVTGIRIRPQGVLLYELSQGTHESVHYEFELSEDRDILVTSTN